MAPQASLEWKSSPPMDYSGQPGHPLHSDTIYNHLCFSYKLRIRKRGSDRKWWNEQEKRNTEGVLSPTTLSTLVGKSQLVNLSLQRQRFRSVQENQFAHRFETWNKEKDTKRWWQFQKALKIPVTFQRRHTIHSFLLYPPLYRIQGSSKKSFRFAIAKFG